MKRAHSMPSYLVVDSSILIFFDRKGQLENFLREKKKENYKVIMPKAIAQEVIDEPKEFAEKIKETVPELANKISDSVARISTAIEIKLKRELQNAGRSNWAEKTSAL